MEDDYDEILTRVFGKPVAAQESAPSPTEEAPSRAASKKKGGRCQYPYGIE